MCRVALLLIALAGCTDDGEWVVGLASLERIEEVEARGREVDITIVTKGGSCMEPDHEEVTVSDDGAMIAVFDRHYLPGGGAKCTLLYRDIFHRVTVSFDYPGVKSFLIRTAPRIEPWTGEEIPTVHLVTESVH